MTSGGCVSCVHGVTGRACGGSIVGEEGTKLADANGYCICQTRPDYYFELDTNEALACDFDQDGWVSDRAIEELGRSGVVGTNARCNVRQVDRFLLIGDARSENGAPASRPMQSVPVSPALPLFESGQNDGQEVAGTTQHAGHWASTDVSSSARLALDPRSINSLTKACISAVEDTNDDGLPDAVEGGGDSASRNVGTTGAAYYNQYVRFAYFVELHDGWYVAPSVPGANDATYVIRERSRVANAPTHVPFHLNFDPPREYWRECSRHSDREYALGMPPGRAGADLVEFSSAQTETMMHHSQFKCVVVNSRADYLADSRQFSISSSPERVFYDNGSSLLHRRVSANSPDVQDLSWGVSRCALSASLPMTTGGGANPTLPAFECGDVLDPMSVDNKTVWAIVDYEPGASAGTYVRGCVNECDELGSMACPQFSSAASGRVACDRTAIGNFGHLACGCTDRFAGYDSMTMQPTCAIGCPDELRHVPVSGFDFASRTGAWVCGDFAITETLSGGGSTGYRLVGGYVPFASFDGRPMGVFPGMSGTGYRITNP